MCKRFVLLLLVFGLAPSTYAHCGVIEGGNIIIISDSGYEPGGILDADGRTKAEGGKYVDESMVAYIGELGYTVDTSGMGGAYRQSNNPFSDPAKVAALNAADLVIFSNYADSSSYDNNRYYWNTLEKPILCQNGDLMQGTSGTMPNPSPKWGWTNAGNDRMYTTTTGTVMNAVPSYHPAYSWMEPIQLFDWPSETGGECPAGCQPALPVGDWVAEAVILCYFNDSWDPYDPPYHDKPILVYVPEGADFDALCGTEHFYGFASADRAYYGHWDYGAMSEYSWDLYVADEYKDLFAVIIADMIPEPATIALLGLGGLALFRRRH